MWAIKLKKKISFRVELVLFMLVSLCISFLLALFIRNNLGYFGNTNKEKRIEKIYEECIGNLEKELMEIPVNETEPRKKILEKYKYLVGYAFYIVDEQGKVIEATVEDTEKIKSKDIYDGMRQYSVSKHDKNVFQILGCDYLKEGTYLYYRYLMYDENDTGMVLFALAGSIFCFFLLIWGRISYISKIRTAVYRITKGELHYRVSYRYNNELLALAEDINEMAKTLEEEEQKKNEFLTNISHDIRTPLTTILGYLEMIQEKKYDSEEEMQDYLNIMERKGNFLASMLEDFFQFSKLQSDDRKLVCIDFALNELLRQFYEDEVEEFAQNALELKIDLCQQDTFCRGDAELLARVVNNLLANALKYSKKHTQVLVQSFTEKREQIQYVGFCVRNTPKNEITKEQLNRLFERQYKCDVSRSDGGSGLGLAIAKSIVKHHGGWIEAHIENGDIIFTVYLKAETL